MEKTADFSKIYATYAKLDLGTVPIILTYVISYSYRAIDARGLIVDMGDALLGNLKDRLGETVQRNRGEGLLLSGGLDSSILSFLAPTATTFTVILEPYGEDIDYASSIATFLGVELCHRTITIKEALDSIPTIIKALGSFDLAIPNDVAAYFGLKLAKENGISCVMTGDGGDELFAGYSYMHRLGLTEPQNDEDIPSLNGYIRRIVRTMRFSSNDLGKFLNMEIRQPYLDKEFIEFALKIAPELKVRFDRGRLWGKWVLRKAFEGLLPERIVWREKRALEFGSGTTRLRDVITSKISDEDFESKRRIYPVRLQNKEHLFYYEIYKEVVGSIPPPRKGEVECSECGAGATDGSHHCRICGAVLTTYHRVGDSGKGDDEGICYLERRKRKRSGLL